MDTNHGALMRRAQTLAQCAKLRHCTTKAYRGAVLSALVLVALVGFAAYMMRPSMFVLSLGMVMCGVLATGFIAIALDYQRDEDDLRKQEGLPPRSKEDSVSFTESLLGKPKHNPQMGEPT